MTENLEKRDPIAQADDLACETARQLLAAARFASLAVIDPATGTPGISRIAFGLDQRGAPLSLISALSAHHQALVATPACALMVGEPGPKGDALTHPRLMLQATATIIDHGDAGRADLRSHWLGRHPKSLLYIDFADFSFVRFEVTSALLNAGFGKAFRLAADDLS